MVAQMIWPQSVSIIIEFPMLPADSPHSRPLSANHCSVILHSLITSAIEQYEEDQQFRTEMDKCKEYIKELQHEIGFVAAAPPVPHRPSPISKDQEPASQVGSRRPAKQAWASTNVPSPSRAAQPQKSQSTGRPSSPSREQRFSSSSKKKHLEQFRAKLNDFQNKKKLMKLEESNSKEEKRLFIRKIVADNEEDSKAQRNRAALKNELRKKRAQSLHRLQEASRSRPRAESEDGSMPFLTKVTHKVAPQHASRKSPVAVQKSSGTLPLPKAIVRPQSKLSQKVKEKAKLTISDYKPLKQNVEVHSPRLLSANFPPHEPLGDFGCGNGASRTETLGEKFKKELSQDWEKAIRSYIPNNRNGRHFPRNSQS